MIGAVIITHGEVADSLLETTAAIAGEVAGVFAIGIKGEETSEDVRERLQDTIENAEQGQGVIVFTDMFGGTPTNIALSLLKEGNTEIITGVNLPLLLKFLNHRDGKELGVLVSLLVEYGRKSIVLASDMLKRESPEVKT